MVQDPNGLIDPRLPEDLAEAMEADSRILILSCPSSPSWPPSASRPSDRPAALSSYMNR
nr:hypothetical protein GCM10020092_034430 [Actinoplanes digitatis]